MPEVHILSGGIDSASVLYRRATETREEIHVLHVRGYMPAAEANTWASRRVAEWVYQHVRPIRYHEFAFTRPRHLRCRAGMFAISGLAIGLYINQHSYIATVVQGTNGDVDQTPDSLARNTYREGVCAATCAGYAPPPTWVYPNFNLPKIEAYRLMPPELRALTLSCATPVQDGDSWRPCSACPACLERARLDEDL